MPEKIGISSKVPLPDTFFAIKAELAPIASRKISVPSAIFIYMVTIGGFGAMWWFYSQPNPPQTNNIVQSDWQKDGYECKPLQKDPHYGLMHTYDECKTKLLPASAATLSLDNATQRWAYKPFADSDAEAVYPKLPPTTAAVLTEIKTPAQLSDGSCFEGLVGAKTLQLTFQTPSTTETVQDVSWYKEGYECKPMQRDDHYKKLWNYSECQSNIRQPNNESVVPLIKDEKFENGWRYQPVQGEDVLPEGADSWDTKTLYNGTFAKEIGFGVDKFEWIFDSKGCLNKECGIRHESSSYGCHCLNDKPAMIKLYDEIISGLGLDLCQPFKENSPFQCKKHYPTSRCVDKESAEKVFNSLNDKYPICDQFKTNAPFQCKKTIITYKSDLEKLSLSVANTELLFGTLTAFFAWFFYKIREKSIVAPSDLEDELEDNELEETEDWQQDFEKKITIMINERFDSLNLGCKGEEETETPECEEITTDDVQLNELKDKSKATIKEMSI
jgi:hypothetical protein